MRVGGIVFGDDGQAAADGLDDAGHFIQIVVHCAALDCGHSGRRDAGTVGSVVDAQAMELAQLLEGVPQVGEDFACVLLFSSISQYSI